MVCFCSLAMPAKHPFEGLADEWEADSSVRRRVRDGELWLPADGSKETPRCSIKEAVSNVCVVRPLVEFMGRAPRDRHGSLVLPTISQLESEILAWVSVYA